MMLAPDDRVILISGANRGIGHAIAMRLHADGYRLSLGVRDLSQMQKAIADWDGSRVIICHYDALDRATHQSWVAATMAHFGQIDGLVNNAGAHETMTVRAPDFAALDRLWTINCVAPLSMISCSLPHLEASGHGRIINIASLSGKRVRNDAIAYNMTKHAMMALNHAARRIAWDEGVRATAICPAFVKTDMAAGATFPVDAMIDPTDVAALVATALAMPNNATMAEMLVNCRLEDTL